MAVNSPHRPTPRPWVPVSRTTELAISVPLGPADSLWAGAADEGGGEGVAADVGGDVLFVEVGVGGDGSDDVAGAADRQPLPAAVQQ